MNFYSVDVKSLQDVRTRLLLIKRKIWFAKKKKIYFTGNFKEPNSFSTKLWNIHFLQNYVILVKKNSKKENNFTKYSLYCIQFEMALIFNNVRFKLKLIDSKRAIHIHYNIYWSILKKFASMMRKNLFFRVYVYNVSCIQWFVYKRETTTISFFIFLFFNALTLTFPFQ